MKMDSRGYDGPVRREPRKRPGLAQLSLPFLALFSGILLIFALLRLLPTDGVVDLAKAVVIGLSATLVAYATNRFAIERGAELAARGYLLAGMVAFGSVLLVGAGLFTATYAGLVIREVEALRLQEHGDALVRHAGALGRSSAAANQAAPVIAAIMTDLRAKHECEVQTSCLSGRPNRGRGPVARALGEKLGKAEAIGAQVERGRSARDAALARMNDLVGRYHAVLARSADDPAEQRRQLVEIDTQVRQVAAEFEAAAPTALLKAYAEELGSAATDNDRLRVILRDHGTALAGALGSGRAEALAFPTFPPRAGVSDTLRYIPHFIPVAAVVAVIELVFPASLLVYRLLSLLWANYQVEHARGRTPVAAADPDDDTDPPPSAPPASPPSLPRFTAEDWTARFPPPVPQIPPRRPRRPRSA